MGRRSRPGPLPSKSGTIIDVLTERAERRTVDGGKGGPFHSLSAYSSTGYPQGRRVFRSEKRAILAVERLEDSLVALRSRLDGLESANKKLELEWTETYDKIRHQLSRMARRGDLSKSTNGQENVDPEVPQEDEIDPISAKIHARRNRSFIGR